MYFRCWKCWKYVWILFRSTSYKYAETHHVKYQILTQINPPQLSTDWTMRVKLTSTANPSLRVTWTPISPQSHNKILKAISLPMPAPAPKYNIVKENISKNNGKLVSLSFRFRHKPHIRPRNIFYLYTHSECFLLHAKFNNSQLVTNEWQDDSVEQNVCTDFRHRSNKKPCDQKDTRILLFGNLPVPFCSSDFQLVCIN